MTFAVSINSTTKCNFRCNSCYLTLSQLKDKTLLPLNILQQKLQQISQYHQITHIDWYGGEVGLLPHEYALDTIEIIKQFCKNKISVITNFSTIPSWFLSDNIEISVSYDGQSRPQYQKIFDNMLLFEKQFNILMLANNQVIHYDVDQLISTFNMITNLKSVEIKPYSTNQANQHDVKFIDFERLIKKWIDSKISKNFIFINQQKIQQCLSKITNSWSDDHIYIAPTGKFAVLDFDQNDNEYFNYLDNFDQYITWTKNEKLKISKNGFCNTCDYYQHCLSEHLRDVKHLTNSCNGFKFLLDWYVLRS